MKLINIKKNKHNFISFSSMNKITLFLLSFWEHEDPVQVSSSVLWEVVKVGSASDSAPLCIAPRRIKKNINNFPKQRNVSCGHIWNCCPVVSCSEETKVDLLPSPL